MQLVTVIVKLRISSRLRELVWVGASPPWRRGPQVRAVLASWGPWGRRRRGTRDAVRSRDRPWRRRSVHRSAKTASRCRFGAFVYTVAMRVATRAASGGASAPTAMACRRRPLGGRLPLGREDRLCVSGATASLVSSPRQQPTQTPGETYLPRIPNKKRLR